MIPSEPDLSIVVPLLDEAASLPELADRIRTACGEAGLRFEVWFVDDGSSDASWRVIQDLHAEDERFAGLRFRRNYGKSAALAVGFEHARGRYVATLDADLQDDPAEVPAMVALLEQEGFDLVSGWKKKRHDPLEKKVPSRFFNFVTRRLSGIPLHDFNCGLKVYRRAVVKDVRVYGEQHRFIPVLARAEGYGRIGEKPVQHHARKHGRTKFGLERYLRGFLDLISVLFLTRYAVRPMHLFGGLGSLFFFLGFLLSLWISIDKLAFGNPIGDRPLLLLGVMLILLGAQMFTTGLLGEAVIRPRMEDTKTYHVVEEMQPGEERSAERSATPVARRA